MRKENWPSILTEQIKAARLRPFSWGQHDCALFAASVINAMTGSELGKEFIGKYKTAAGAKKIIDKFGGIEAMANKYFEEVPVYFCQRGDLVMTQRNGQLTLGICVGENCAFPGIEKLEYLKLSECTKAWRV
jgi:hypothetical protein